VTKVIRDNTGRAWLDVDLDALGRNARRFAERSGTRLLPMVKANGYGLGADPVTRALEPLDPWGYGVATTDEGSALRSAGITRPILVFTPFTGGPPRVAEYAEAGLRSVIGDLAGLDAWLGAGGGPFHIEIDSGLSRAGFSWRDRDALAELREKLRSARGFEGIFTHFHSPDRDAGSVTTQLERFERIVAALDRRPGLVHTANSAAVGLTPVPPGDLARPGIFLYGGTAGSMVPEPVARLRARVVALRILEPGDTVSYGAEWRASKRTSIATLSIGYADGVLRSLGNRGVVELDGRLVPLVGRITMDLSMVEVGDLPIRIGDVATVFGGRVTLDEQAGRAGTSSYELLTAVSARVPRCYQESASGGKS
jgi:alanine racemase